MIIWGCRDVGHIRIRGTSPLLQIWVGGVGLYGCRVRRVPLLSRMCPDNLSVVVGAPIGFMWGSYLEYEASGFASNMICGGVGRDCRL